MDWVTCRVVVVRAKERLLGDLVVMLSDGASGIAIVVAAAIAAVLGSLVFALSPSCFPLLILQLGFVSLPIGLDGWDLVCGKLQVDLIASFL